MPTKDFNLTREEMHKLALSQEARQARVIELLREAVNAMSENENHYMYGENNIIHVSFYDDNDLRYVCNIHANQLNVGCTDITV